MTTLLTQTWRHTLFVHWPLDREDMAAKLPKGLELDLFEGSAWLTATVLLCDDNKPLGISLPFIGSLIGAFPQLNSRTYVRYKGEPGVWFLEIQAASQAAAQAGPFAYGLPYEYRPMTLDSTEDWIAFESPDLAVSYKPQGAAWQAKKGSREEWLLERYSLFSETADGLLRGDIEHKPWSLRNVETRFSRNLLTDEAPAALQYAERQRVKIGTPYVANVRSPASPKPGTI